MANETRNTIVLVLAGAAAFVAYLATRAEAQFQNINPTTGTPGDSADSWVPTTSDGEVGVDVETGVTYDDPESGQHNDEPEDDQNATFEEVNTNDSPVDDTDPETYAPDVQDGSTAPSSGVIADPGTSQNWGSAPEQENDDLTKRSAESKMSDDMKSAFDRLANRDDL